MGQVNCCQQKEIIVDFTYVKSINEVLHIISLQLNRINREISDTSKSSNDKTEEMRDDESKRFYYYMKLEMILVKIKLNLERSSVTNKFLEDETILTNNY